MYKLFALALLLLFRAGIASAGEDTPAPAPEAGGAPVVIGHTFTITSAA